MGMGQISHFLKGGADSGSIIHRPPSYYAIWWPITTATASSLIKSTGCGRNIACLRIFPVSIRLNN